MWQFADDIGETKMATLKTDFHHHTSKGGGFEENWTEGLMYHNQFVNDVRSMDVETEEVHISPSEKKKLREMGYMNL